MTTPSHANTSGLGDAGLSETYRFAYESIRNGAPGLSDATCAAIARSINMKVSLSKTDCATEADALRLVPRRAVYDWLRDDVPLNVKMTVMPHHIDALMDRLSKAATAAEARADRLAKALKETRNRVREWPIDDHETCMCGSPAASHGMGDGHSPVSQGDHAISMIVEAINEALQQETQP